MSGMSEMRDDDIRSDVVKRISGSTRSLKAAIAGRKAAIIRESSPPTCQ